MYFCLVQYKRTLVTMLIGYQMMVERGYELNIKDYLQDLDKS